LTDPDLSVRAAGVLAVPRLDPARAPKELRRLSKERSPVVLTALTEAWSLTPNPPVAALKAFARHADPTVRAAAVAALARLRVPLSAEEVEVYARDAVAPVRLAALATITSESMLRKLAHDHSPEVGTAADERLVALLGRTATLTERLAALSHDDEITLARVQMAASWLLAH